MKRQHLKIALALAVAVFLTTGWGRRQQLNSQPQQQEQPDFTIRSDVRLVLLDVNVTDRHGSRVSGLTKDNFTILENGKPQPVTVFAKEDLPVTVGIVVDESYSMRPKRTDVIAAAVTFIENSNPQDEMFVINFNNSIRFGLPDDVPFSGDITQLRKALHLGVPQGQTALYDAVIRGLEKLKSGSRDKKALVLISDGGDTASVQSRRAMLDAALRAQATIYAIGVYTEDDPDRDPAILRELARITGGDAYFPATYEGTKPVCERVARDIRTRYTLGYVPQTGAGDFRQIKVRASAPGQGGLRVQTRSSYHYEELQKQSQR